MTFKEKILNDTSNYEVGYHWRFQHQEKTYTELNMNYSVFLKNMFVLCDEDYFEAIKDGKAYHFIILKK